MFAKLAAELMGPSGWCSAAAAAQCSPPRFPKSVLGWSAYRSPSGSRS
jgi:hypothetical protein